MIKQLQGSELDAPVRQDEAVAVKPLGVLRVGIEETDCGMSGRPP